MNIDQVILKQYAELHGECGCNADPTVEISQRCPNPKPMSNLDAINVLSDPLTRIRMLAEMESEIKLAIDMEIRDACEYHSNVQVAKAAGVSEMAIRKRKNRGWIRLGYLGQNQTRRPSVRDE